MWHRPHYFFSLFSHFLFPSLQTATAAHVERFLPRTRWLWHTRATDLHALPLSSPSECVCISQVRTAIDLGKIKRSTCRLNMIWLTVEFGLDNTVAHNGAPFHRTKLICYERKDTGFSSSGRKIVWKLKTSKLNLKAWKASVVSLSLDWDASIFPSLSHFYHSVTMFSACLYVCMWPNVSSLSMRACYFYLFFFPVALCTLVCLLPSHRDVPFHVRAIPRQAAFWVKSPEESAQMSGWCFVLKCIRVKCDLTQTALYTGPTVALKSWKASITGASSSPTAASMVSVILLHSWCLQRRRLISVTRSCQSQHARMESWEKESFMVQMCCDFIF